MKFSVEPPLDCVHGMAVSVHACMHGQQQSTKRFERMKNTNDMHATLAHHAIHNKAKAHW